MKTSDNGALALIRREALVLSTYKDSKGIPTIGVGHTAAAGQPVPTSGLKMTFPVAFALFKSDLAKYEAGVNRAVTAPLKQYEYDALVSFHFNTGAIGKASFIKKLNAGDRAGAIKGFMDWNKPPEIIGRRLEEQHQFATGDYGNIASIPVYDKYPGKPRLLNSATALGTPATIVTVPTPTPKPPVISLPEPPVVTPAPVDPTPDPVVDPVPPTPVVPVDMMAVEQRLKALGYDIDADGILDPKTKLGIVAFKLKWNTDNPDHALPLDDTITPDVAQALLSTPLPVARTEATSKDLRAEGSTIATSTFRLKNMGKWLVGAGGTAVIGPQAADQLEGGKKLLNSVTEFVTSIPPIVWIAAVVAIGAFIWVDARKAEKARVDMRRKGEIA